MTDDINKVSYPSPELLGCFRTWGSLWGQLDKGSLKCLKPATAGSSGQDGTNNSNLWTFKTACCPPRDAKGAYEPLRVYWKLFINQIQQWLMMSSGLRSVTLHYKISADVLLTFNTSNGMHTCRSNE